MALQTEYNETLDAGRVGLVADTNDKTLISRIVEETIAFGMAVSQGVADRAVKLPLAGEPILGISVLERSSINDEWVAPESARIMTRGTIYVVAVADVVAGDVVHGMVGGTLSNTGGVLIANARFEDTATAGDLTRIRIA